MNYLDMNGFPEVGVPVLKDARGIVSLGYLNSSPLRNNGLSYGLFTLDIGGASRINGVIFYTQEGYVGCSLSNVITISGTGGGIIQGFVNIFVSNDITASNTIYAKYLGNLLARISKGYFRDIDCTNKPLVGGDPVALMGDLRYERLLASQTYSQIHTHPYIPTEQLVGINGLLKSESGVGGLKEAVPYKDYSKLWDLKTAIPWVAGSYSAGTLVYKDTDTERIYFIADCETIQEPVV
jgi:hypothetical protein